MYYDLDISQLSRFVGYTKIWYHKKVYESLCRSYQTA